MKTAQRLAPEAAAARRTSNHPLPGATLATRKTRGRPAALLLCLALLVPATAHAGRVRYQVAPGDSLREIAEQYDVSVRDLKRWNDLDSDMIRIGQTLTIQTSSGGGDRTLEEYTVRSGDTGGAIARRHGVTVAELRRWNPNLNLDRLRIGQKVKIYVSGAGQAGSAGSPDRGRLRGGVPLPDGAGYIIEDRTRAYGTPETVSAISNGIARVSARFIDVPRLEIHDLSTERGGRLAPHKSHQNGLDADISYYRLDTGSIARWGAVDPENLDPRLQWYLFRTWLEAGVVEYIFVDYDLQAPLYEYARARGATEEQLDEWFEYPNRGSQGVIRHERGHDDHFHVRFFNSERMPD